MDYKEFLEMLVALGIVPGKLSRVAVQEVFRQVRTLETNLQTRA